MSHAKVLQKKDPEFFAKLKKVHRGFISPSGVPSSCWEFTGTLFENGYGRVYEKDVAPGETKAHRYSFILAKGKIGKGKVGKHKGKTLYILHKCDNRVCCNPNHLYAADHRQNMDDMIERNRQAVGVSNARATKTELDAAFIKLMISLGFSYLAIGEIIGISKSSVSKFKQGSRTWQHISPMPLKRMSILAYIKARHAEGLPLTSSRIALAKGTSSASKQTTVGAIRNFVDIVGQVKVAEALNSTRKKIRTLLEKPDEVEVEVNLASGDFQIFHGERSLTPGDIIQLLQDSKYVR